jgi:hypothetical protein
MDRARYTTCSVFFDESGGLTDPTRPYLDSLQYAATIVKVQSVGLHGLL